MTDSRTPGRVASPQVLWLDDPDPALPRHRWLRIVSGGMALAGVVWAVAAVRPSRDAEFVPLPELRQAAVPTSPAPRATETPTETPAVALPAKRRTQPARPASRLPAVPAEPGRLFVSSTPWGTLYVDDWAPRNTPIADLPLPPGNHRIRIVRPGYESYDQTIQVAPGEHVRLTGIVLRKGGP